MKSSDENSNNVVKSDIPTGNSIPSEGARTQAQLETIPSSDASISKVIKRQSNAWLHFTKNESGDTAKCNHCETTVSCKIKQGVITSTMLDHLKRCRGFTPDVADEEHKGKRHKQTTMLRKQSDGGAVPRFLSFDPEACHRAIVRYIIMDEVSFRSIERKGFKDIVHTLQPRTTIPSRKTLVRDVVGMYEKEKRRLQKFFKNFNRSVCLSTDLWVSRQNLSYMSLTAHYIDDDWNLQKKILNFCLVDNHSSLVIGKAVETCLLSWGIEKVFTITVDNASTNDVGLKYLRERLRVWGGLVLDGEYLHMRCGAHILNLIIKDELDELKFSIDRIRSAIIYVKGSAMRTQKFKTCMEQQKLHTDCVASLDVETRWNSTYLMLEAALKLKPAFELLEIEDEKFREELRKNGKSVPTEDDWTYVRGFLPFLKCFYDTTVKILESKYVTGNLYVKEIFRVAFNINMMTRTNDEAVQLMADKMQCKFFKYWGDFRKVNVLIYLAAVFDPRHKMKWVSWLITCVYKKSDARELLEKIENTLEQLFQYYETLTADNDKVGSSSKLMESHPKNDPSIDDLDALMVSMFEQYATSKRQCIAKSELVKYLSDECEDQHETSFDILYWWKTKGSKYKIVSRMAMDLLAVPASTITSRSAFSTDGRIIHPFCSSLTPNLVQAFICTQDWIKTRKTLNGIEEIYEKLENLEKDISSEEV